MKTKHLLILTAIGAVVVIVGLKYVRTGNLFGASSAARPGIPTPASEAQPEAADNQTEAGQLLPIDDGSTDDTGVLTLQ